MSAIDILAMVLPAILLGYFIYLMVVYLNKSDRENNRVSQCPPHAWDAQYRDPTAAELEIDPKLTHVYTGLRCGKCKRRPGELYTSIKLDFGPWGNV